MTDLAATYNTKNLTIRYLIALSLVALLIIFAYLLIRLAIYKQASDAPVINYSGRQRMLSQKLAKETLLLTLNPSLKIKERYRQELAGTVATWLRVHNGLQFGDKELDLPGNNSEEVKDLFAEMEPYHRKMKIAVKKILTLKSNNLAQLSLDSHLIQDIVKASSLYLKWMDRVVFQYDHEAQVRVDLLKQYETYIMAAVMFLLAAEALLIFRPMVSRVKRSYKNLQQTNEQLKQEIVERKHTEAKLESTRSYADNIINSSLDMIITVDGDRKIVEFNEAAIKTFGYKKEEVLGKTSEMLYASQEEAAKIAESLDRKSHFLGEALNKKKSGKIFSSYVSASFIMDKEGNFWGAMSISRDITDQKKMEEALRESEIKFRSVTQSATDAIISADSNGKIISWNNGAFNMFGYDEEEVLNKPVSMFMPERYRKSHEEGLRMAVSEGENKIIGKTLELEGLRKDGEEFSIELSISKWNTHKGTFFTGIIRDVTNRKALETQLSHAQKLESIGSLAAGIAHEINTPTQFVSDNIHFIKESFEDIERLLNKYADMFDASKKGNVTDDLFREIESVIEETDMDFLQKEIPKAIEASQRGANRVSTIVKAMKEFSHPGTKEKTPTDINHAITNTVTISKNEWKYVAEVKTDFDENLPLVPCLPGDFNQVILNLITNAAHAIGKVVEVKEESKGSITISTRKDGDFAEVTVSDTGAGIPDSIKDKIFLPFFTTKEVGKGTGQGLAISHSVIVDKHKGTLSFESEEGKGTTFSIRLPLKEKNK